MMCDTAIFDLIEQECQRQQNTINLIASENYASKKVLAATGSVLSNKYAEGYPGKRYYGGCTIIDDVEQLAIDRCKKIFNAEHVNVQPHSGSQANMAVYFAFLKPGDTILGMGLAEGGHLTHGHSLNFSGRLFNVIPYSLDPKTHLLDYSSIEYLAKKHKPKLIIAGATAYSRVIDFAKFNAIAQSVGALLLADIAHIAGLIAAGLHPNPFPHADIVTSTTHKTLRGPRGGLIMCKKEFASAIDKSIMPGMQGGPLMNGIAAKAVAFYEVLQPEFVSYQKQIIKNAKTIADALQAMNHHIVTDGTDNHLMIVDLRESDVSGLVIERALNTAGIMVSRSCVPFDSAKTWVTSGIRIGTPAVTTRGMKEYQMQEIAQLVHDVINNHKDDIYLKAIKKKVENLCEQFPIYS